MYIDSIELINFRNFINEKILFNKNAIIVGANDVGKTNLLYAIRLLLDYEIPESKLLPNISDFNVRSEETSYKVTIKFCEVTEDCIIAMAKGNISENGEFYIRLEGSFDRKTGKRTYELFIGKSEDELTTIPSRYYLKTLNVKYIESSRDLNKYIRKEKKWLLETTKEQRSDDEIEHDDTISSEITRCLECVSQKVSTLNYIKRSTDKVNETLKKLSARNSKKSVSFATPEVDATILLDKLSLTATDEDHLFELGGDGFINQTHLSLWGARHSIENEHPDTIDSVTFFCIEEIEAHLHPHQQRRLAQFMREYFGNSQVLLTTHSPQIASHFHPEHILRLKHSKEGTTSYSYRKRKFTETEAINFGYRMNVISAEVYFADSVFLVEGPSEKLFYEALAKANKIPCDFYNTSIIDVNGIDFAPYCDLAVTMGTAFVLRTDNDISKVPKKDRMRYAGVIRARKMGKLYADDFSSPEAEKEALSWDIGNGEEQKTAEKTALELKRRLESFGIYLAEKDLEHDLINTTLEKVILASLDKDDIDSAITKLQSKKALNMFSLLRDITGDLEKLHTGAIVEPLIAALENGAKSA